MAATYTTTKAQGATLDYSIALANGDTIASAAWTVTGATKVSESYSSTAALVRVSGGTVGTPAELVCHIVGASGLEYERTIEPTITAEFIVGDTPIIKAPAEVLAVPAPTITDLNGDTVESYDWSAAAGLTVVSGYATTATTRISGGTLGRDYSLTCTLTFTSGQILPCVVLVQVRKR
jgi:hypothetical protein